MAEKSSTEPENKGYGKKGENKRYLDDFYDVAMKVNPSWTPDDEVAEQRERLTQMATVPMQVLELKRRLGQDADPNELKQDKKKAKQVLNRLTTALMLWGGKRADIEERYIDVLSNPESKEHAELTQTAAQMDWEEWWAEHKLYLQQDARRLATHCLKLADRKTGNKMTHKLFIEWGLLEDVLEEIA